MSEHIMSEEKMTGKPTEEIKRLETPQDAEALCTNLMEATGELISVLERETALVRKAQYQDLSALHLKKQSLSTILTRNMELLRENADYIKKSAPNQVAQLKEQQRQFQKSLDSNHDALKAVTAVSEQLIQTIASAVGERRGGPQTYGKNAGVSTPKPNQPAAISVDTRL